MERLALRHEDEEHLLPVEVGDGTWYGPDCVRTSTVPSTTARSIFSVTRCFSSGFAHFATRVRWQRHIASARAGTSRTAQGAAAEREGARDACGRPGCNQRTAPGQLRRSPQEHRRRRLEERARHQRDPRPATGVAASPRICRTASATSFTPSSGAPRRAGRRGDSRAPSRRDRASPRSARAGSRRRSRTRRRRRPAARAQPRHIASAARDLLERRRGQPVRRVAR